MHTDTPMTTPQFILNAQYKEGQGKQLTSSCPCNICTTGWCVFGGSEVESTFCQDTCKLFKKYLKGKLDAPT